VNLNIGKFANNIGGGSTIKKVSIGAQGANAASAATGDKSKLSAFLRPGQNVDNKKSTDEDTTAKDNEKQKQEKLINEKPEDAGKTANKITKDFTKLALKNTEDKNAEGDKVSRHPEETPKAKPQSSLDNKAESNKLNISDIKGQVKDNLNNKNSTDITKPNSDQGLSYDNKAIENMGSNKDNRFGDAMKESPKSTSPEAVAKDYGFSTPDSVSGAGSTPGMGGANGFGGGPGGPGANQPPVTINNVNNNNVNPGMSQPQMTPPPQNITPPPTQDVKPPEPIRQPEPEPEIERPSDSGMAF
jgi:hypothetical protein